MSPTPVEAAPTGAGQLVSMATAATQQQGAGRISLAVLIDYIVQRTYHDLTVLSELLPRKSDIERKVEIVQLAHKTRQLFIRLLALVKWANSAAKVYRCSDIMMFLDQQAMLFTDTADMLAQIAREKLVNARLPNFSLPLAVDVLTTGTFPRLPACIRDRIVPPDPITETEKQSTLQSLDNIIQYRLVTSSLPPQMRNLTIEDGRVTFHVEHEFEVSLTLMGDGPVVPWRLLEIDILVQNKETGDGKALVHPLQIHYIHQLLQSRMIDNSQPLHDLYNCLHSFCQSLQLEVLNFQADKLMQERLGASIRIAEYTPGRCLSVTYWRKGLKNYTVSDYSLSVQVDAHDSNKPLQVVHKPVIRDSTLAEQAVKSEHLSIEKLLIHTIHVRAKGKLEDISSTMEKFTTGKSVISGTPAVLFVPLLSPCIASEQLHVSVDFLTGRVLTSIPLWEPVHQTVKDIENALNGEKADLERLLTEVRFELMLSRIDRTVQHQFVECHTELPLVGWEQSPLQALSKHRMYLCLTKYSNCYVVVEFNESEEDRRIIVPTYYMMTAKVAAYEGAPPDTPTPYLRVTSLIQFDTYAITHGPFTQAAVPEQEKKNGGYSGKRKLSGTDSASKKLRAESWYHIPELAHAVAMCEERIPFWVLSEELSGRGEAHQGIEVDPFGTGLVLKMITMPGVTVNKGARNLQKKLINCAFRVQGGKPTRLWVVEFVLVRGPLLTICEKEQTPRQHIYFQYDFVENEKISEVVDAFIEHWKLMVHLYVAVVDFADYMLDVQSSLCSIVEVYSYNYKKLVLNYGPMFSNQVVLEWSVQEKQFKLTFCMARHESPYTNCHSIVSAQLQCEFNQHRSIPQLVQVLHETYYPLVAVAKLPTNPTLAGSTNLSRAVQNFSVIVQSSTHIKIAFRSTYCLDVHCRSGGLVAVRDGAYSLFDKSKAIEGFNPTQGLKTLLNMYVDDSSSRSRSMTEDDNPPSPMEPVDSFLAQQQPGVGSPAQRGDGLRFHHPMTPPSNPHTPASPHTSVLHQGYPSPGSGFPLSSPPTVAPSPSLQMPTPSPGGLLSSSPSPALHAPSPGQVYAPVPHMHSPAFMQPSDNTASPSRKKGNVPGAESGSPFPSNLPMQSPGTRWPASPSMPGPSPASRLPVAMSPGGHPALHSPSSVEAVRGAVAGLRNYVLTRNEDNLMALPTTEPGVLMMKVETLTCRVALHPATLQMLQLKLSPLPELQDQWSVEELQVLETAFECKVACTPYKPNAILAFSRLLAVPMRILKDCVKLMHLELRPDRCHKWSVQWCWTIPPSAPHIAPAGTAAIITTKNKILFYLHLTRVGMALPVNVEPQTIVVPIVYETQANQTLLADPRGLQMPPVTANSIISTMLKRFAEFHNNQMGECSIFPAVQDLLTNLVIPTPGATAGPPNAGGMGMPITSM
ncbi:PREDICTED: mediator of RNA polymerase II transcription subunit 14-like [Priapulus caudatus]|uniref:Mediator of RNA polymerase II transcription subunit 14 n=1 Tax=Priapulus caudatus TaxID=37621 RepID=A0ABM1F8A3_PRICU|nr:PREDICTED: mediator of RNA polymerase II transcription subunit 14-like [Priapulus caudatus]